MSLLEQLAKELETIQKHSSPSGTHSTPSGYEPGGLFGTPGLERDIISTRVTANGLASVLQAVPSDIENPLYPYLTGRADDVGTQSANACDDAPTAGNFLTCYQTAQFGITSFATRELEVNKIGRLENRGVMTDLRFVNDPLVEDLGNNIMPNIANKDMAFAAGREMLLRMVEVGNSFQEYLSTKLWTGTGTGVEFPGLEQLVVSTHYDAKTGTACDSLASVMTDFGDVDITTAAGADAIVSTLIENYREVRYNASSQRFDPATFAIVMRPQVFVNVTDVWGISYHSFGALTANTLTDNTVMASDVVAMRDAMRMGSYLVIDGMQVPVIQDPWMPETDLGDGVHSSDIYILPMTVVGGRRVLYWQHFNFDGGPMQAIRDGGYVSEFTSDAGRYLWVRKPQKNFCIQLQSKVEARIILETPQLASRIQNVAVTLNTHWNDPGRTSLYDSNSGDGVRATDTLYNQWNNTP